MRKIDNNTKMELEEKVKEIMEIAQIHKLPFFLTIAIADDNKETTYIKELFSAQVNGIQLTNDTIRKHELVEAGFDVVPPRDNLTLNMEEVFYGE